MLARAATWWTLLRINLEERLVYRGDFALATLMRFLPVVTQIFLWGAVFSARAAARPHDPKIAGYTYQAMVAYYLLTMVSRAFSSMPGLSSGIAQDIRDGTVKKYLIQPIDMLGLLFLGRVAHKLVYYLVAAVPFAAVFYLCRGFFPSQPGGIWPGWPDAYTLLAYLASLLMSFLLAYLLEATIGMIGFWFLEVNSLLFVYMLLSFFCSGHMFPIDLLPEVWGDLVRLTPLPYLAYFPAAVFLGRLSGPQVIEGLWLQLGWIFFFLVAARIAFYFGVRRYSGFGG
jgi:ABC-2 type transport system permease protein